jgi:DNA-binding GntR family transcriptional regulator
VVAKIPRKSAAEAGNGRRMSDIAYRRILELLFDRKLPAGSFVSQSDLVAMSGIPLAPLRDALRVLEAEGVVLIHPRTGIQVVKPGPELTRSAYHFRSIIESSAASAFTETASDEAIQDLIAQHRAVVAMIERDGTTDQAREETERLELLFHNSLVGSLQNPLVDTSHRRIHNYLRIVRLDRRVTVPVMLRTLQEHLAILEAASRRDTAAATAAVHAHLNAALQRNLGLYYAAFNAPG